MIFPHQSARVRRIISTALLCLPAWIMTDALAGEQVWTIAPQDPAADFGSVQAALDSPEVLDGDTLQLSAKGSPYGTVVMTRPLHLEAMEDLEEETVVETLIFNPEARLPDGTLQVRGLVLNSCAAESAGILFLDCRIGSVQTTGDARISFINTWIETNAGGYLRFEDASTVHMQNCLVLLNNETAVIFGLNSNTTLIHNTIIDAAGDSEWTVRDGLIENCILTVPEGRLALFGTEVRGNISSRYSFKDDPDNLNSVLREALFDEAAGGLAAYVPLPGGAASGAASDGSDIGFTGGDSPVDLGRIPGSGIEEDKTHKDLENLFGEDLVIEAAWANSPWYGWMQDLGEGHYFHLNHSFQYAIGEPASLFIYDFGSSLWFWTSRQFYPVQYLFTPMPGWAYFYSFSTYPDRYFYLYASGEILHESQL